MERLTDAARTSTFAGAVASLTVGTPLTTYSTVSAQMQTFRSSVQARVCASMGIIAGLLSNVNDTYAVPSLADGLRSTVTIPGCSSNAETRSSISLRPSSVPSSAESPESCGFCSTPYRLADWMRNFTYPYPRDHDHGRSDGAAFRYKAGSNVIRSDATSAIVDFGNFIAMSLAGDVRSATI